MTPEEVRYHLLNILQDSPHLNQRDLARELGVSLGKVNYCLRALIDKGFVKAGNFSRSQHKVRYLYVLTPAGLDEKLSQTRKFLARKQAEYDVLKREIERLTAELNDSEPREKST